jgi:hypothetical protein
MSKKHFRESSKEVGLPFVRGGAKEEPGEFGNNLP